MAIEFVGTFNRDFKLHRTSKPIYRIINNDQPIDVSDWFCTQVNANLNGTFKYVICINKHPMITRYNTLLTDHRYTVSGYNDAVGDTGYVYKIYSYWGFLPMEPTIGAFGRLLAQLRSTYSSVYSGAEVRDSYNYIRINDMYAGNCKAGTYVSRSGKFNNIEDFNIFAGTPDEVFPVFKELYPDDTESGVYLNNTVFKDYLDWDSDSAKDGLYAPIYNIYSSRITDPGVVTKGFRVPFTPCFVYFPGIGEINSTNIGSSDNLTGSSELIIYGVQNSCLGFTDYLGGTDPGVTICCKPGTVFGTFYHSVFKEKSPEYPNDYYYARHGMLSLNYVGVEKVR